ncbi:hypothetical protein [Rhizobacter sp. Root1221]|uniref:hypothetical protein n=1 Tax=Rhizobacter sp. Root1221 TaxID=1736433 RepID=UPI0012F8ED6C|nr:hypothetical protein [Rhizobacter sp. Root1221]
MLMLVRLREIFSVGCPSVGGQGGAMQMWLRAESSVSGMFASGVSLRSRPDSPLKLQMFKP